jgi:pyruvate kinase
VDAGRVRCRVVVGGEVKAIKGVNLPGGVRLPIPSLSGDVDDLVRARAGWTMSPSVRPLGRRRAELKG